MVGRSANGLERKHRLVGMPARRSQTRCAKRLSSVPLGTPMPVNAIVDNFDYGRPAVRLPNSSLDFGGVFEQRVNIGRL